MDELMKIVKELVRKGELSDKHINIEDYLLGITGNDISKVENHMVIILMSILIYIEE